MQLMPKNEFRFPLSGIKVLDLTRYIAGPYCTMLLGDFGADVVKVEKPGVGDDTRQYGPRLRDETMYFLSFNRNKRSIELNSRSPDGARKLRDLALRADVLVENFRPGVLEAMGLDPLELRKKNPGLIVTRISGYGQDGPDAQKLAFDAIAQAETGLMSLTGDPDEGPYPIGTYLVDYSAGMQAAFATVVALYERTRSGEGQVVDVSLLETAFSMLLTGPLQYEYDRDVMTRVGRVDRYAAPAAVYPTQDGWIYIVAKDDGHFARLATAMGRLELPADERYSSIAARIAHRETIDAEVASWTKRWKTDDLLAILLKSQIPAAPVNDIGQAMQSAQLKHRGAMVEVQHGRLGPIRVPGVVAKLERTPGDVRLAPPVLGAHTDEVFLDWLAGSSADGGTLS